MNQASPPVDAEAAVTDRYEVITEWIKERAGAALRIVFQYTAGSIDTRYVNEQLLGEDLLPRLESLRTRALKLARGSSSTSIARHGDVETLLAAHEDAVVLYLFASETEGLVAVHDRVEDLFDGQFI